MLNLKSFEDFLNEDGEFTSIVPMYRKLNESTDKFSEDFFNKIARLSGQRCLVFNDIEFAEKLSENKNDVWCICFNYKGKFPKSNVKYASIDLKSKGQKVHPETIKKLLYRENNKGEITEYGIFLTNPIFKDKTFDFIFNISLESYGTLTYNVITNLNIFILSNFFTPGITAYYSFDEKDVSMQFAIEVKELGYRSKEKKKIPFNEWKSSVDGYGFNSNYVDTGDSDIDLEKHDRYLSVIYVDNDEYLNNRENLDETDNIGVAESMDETGIIKGMVEPEIYAFKANMMDEALNIDALKVGDTNRGVDVRIGEWSKKYAPEDTQYKVDLLGHWSSVISGCGEGLDGKIFRDKSIHKILMNDEKFQEKGIRNVGTPEERETLKEKGIYFSNEFFENCTTKDVQDAIDILYDSIRKNRINVISELKEASKSKYDFIFPLHNIPVPFKPRKLQQDVIDTFKDRFKRNYKEMLIYAVMRFGKTFVACECVKNFCELSEKKNGKFILVVSAKVDVKDEWLGAVNPYSDYVNIDMYTSRKGVGGLLNMLTDKREWIHKEYVKDENEEDGFKKDENGEYIIDIDKSIPGPHPNESFNTLDEYFRAHPEKNIMLFASFQDLNGNNQNFDKLDEIERPEDIDYVKQQHKCFFDYPIDMIIIDEAHYGAQADSFGYLIGEGGVAIKRKKSKSKTTKTNPETGEVKIEKKDYDLIMSKLKIENALKLHLSGTPYNLVYDEHFKDDEIIAKFSFADLMSAKDEWINRYKKFIDDQIPVHIDVEEGEDPDPNEGKILSYENNPYYGIPEMLNFGYKFDEFQLKQLKGIGSYDFNTLFKIDESKKKFVYESDILQMFQAIDGSKKKSGVLDLLNEPQIKKGNMCKHIVMVLPSKDSCDVMANFLEKKKNKLKNLGRYTVINIAGNTTNYDTKTAKKMIYTENAHGNKTISLTVDRMLTGVTVKPWDTMFYMKDGLSPQSYDQAKFRIQTPYVKNVPELELTDDMKTIGVVKDENGNIVAHKVDMKPQTVFVDFSADRIFVLLHNRYVAELAAQGITEDSSNYEDEYVKLAEKDLKYLPIITHETGKLKSLTSENIMGVIRKSLARAYFDKELDDLIKSIKWPEPNDKDVDNIDDFPTRYSEKKTGKDTLITSANKGEEEKVDSSLLAKDDEEIKETTLKHKPINKMTPEEKSALFMKFRNQCQTIMMNFAVYFIARKDNQKIFRWKHIFADSMRNVDTDTEGNRTDGINVGIIINVFGDGIIPENFNERQEKVKKIKRELGYWKDYYLTKKPGLQEEVLNKLIAMAERYDGEKRDFNNIKSSLKSFSKLGKTEFITPDDLSEKLLENVVIFSKDTKILDCYGSKIGEILNYLSTNEKFAEDFNIDNYYLIVKNSMIAELCKVVFNIAYERQIEWNSKQRKDKDKKYLTFKDKDGKEYKKLTFSNRFEKENWFDSHILIYNTDKLEKEEEEKETEKKSMDTSTETPIEISSENQINQGINDGYVFSNIKPLIEKRVKSTVTVMKDKNKVSVVELENAIKNKWGEQMDWQIIIGNPPYGKNLHLKIINTVINHLTEDGVASFIHPARWYEDPLAETKKKATDKVKFKDIVNKLERVEIIDVLTANSKFHIANETDLMISHINNKHTGGISSIYNTPFVKEALNCILKASNIDNLSNHIEYNKLDGYRCEIKKQQSFQSERPSRVDEYSRLKNVSIVLLNNNCFKDGYELDSGKWWGNCKKSDGGSPKPEGTPIPLSIHFDNENDLRNFVIGYNSKFIRNIFSILKFSSSVQFEYYPYIQMKKKWSDEDFCKFFGKLGMSKECQEWMCREVSDYRTKDFINYMKFDDSKLEENQEEYSEIPIDPDSSPSGSESLPKSIYDLELRRLDPNPEIPEDEKYKEEDLKNAYPDKYERFEKDGEDYSFRYWLYKELDK